MPFDGEFYDNYEIPIGRERNIAIKDVATSIHSGSKDISKSLNNVANSLSDVANSLSGIELLASIFDKGISEIVDKSHAAHISDEYYMVLDRLLLLKEKHPNITIEVSIQEISDSLISLPDEMMIVLSYLFTYSDTKVFELFKLECESGKISPKDWLNSFYSRSGKIFKYINTEESFEWNDYILVCGAGLLKDYENWTGINNSLDKLISKVYELYSESDNWFYIAKGAKKLNAWITEQNCILAVKYLKKIYSEIAINQVLNAK